MDFRGATNHFADLDFDGEPVQIYDPGEDDTVLPPDGDTTTDEPGGDQTDGSGENETIIDGGDHPDITISEGGGRRGKVYVDGVAVQIVAEADWQGRGCRDDRAGRLDARPDTPKPTWRRRYARTPRPTRRLARPDRR